MRCDEFLVAAGAVSSGFGISVLFGCSHFRAGLGCAPGSRAVQPGAQLVRSERISGSFPGTALDLCPFLSPVPRFLGFGALCGPDHCSPGGRCLWPGGMVKNTSPFHHCL